MADSTATVTLNPAWLSITQQAINPRLRELAQHINTGLAASAPRSTGRLAAASTAQVVGDHIDVGTRTKAAFYGKFVERGTKFMPARRYMAHAVETAITELRAQQSLRG